MARPKLEEAIAALVGCKPEHARALLEVIDALRIEYHDAERRCSEMAQSRDEHLAKCAEYSRELARLRGIIEGARATDFEAREAWILVEAQKHTILRLELALQRRNRSLLAARRKLRACK